MAAGKVNVLLVVSGLDMDRSAEGNLVNMYVNIKEGNMGGEKVQVNQTGKRLLRRSRKRRRAS
jgi:hypothetical protein